MDSLPCSRSQATGTRWNVGGARGTPGQRGEEARAGRKSAGVGQLSTGTETDGLAAMFQKPGDGNTVECWEVQKYPRVAGLRCAERAQDSSVYSYGLAPRGGPQGGLARKSRTIARKVSGR